MLVNGKPWAELDPDHRKIFGDVESVEHWQVRKTMRCVADMTLKAQPSKADIKETKAAVGGGLEARVVSDSIPPLTVV